MVTVVKTSTDTWIAGIQLIFLLPRTMFLSVYPHQLTFSAILYPFASMASLYLWSDPHMLGLGWSGVSGFQKAQFERGGIGEINQCYFYFISFVTTVRLHNYSKLTGLQQQTFILILRSGPWKKFSLFRLHSPEQLCSMLWVGWAGLGFEWGFDFRSVPYTFVLEPSWMSSSSLG